jgi:hypothetical protein
MKTLSFEVFYQRQLNFAVTFAEVRKLAVERWGDDIGNVHPSFFPGENDQLVVFNGVNSKKHHSHDCLEFLKRNEFHLPNVHGLVLLELLDKEFDFLKENSWVLGLDYLHHLSRIPKHGHMVPALMKESVGSYEYVWLPWSSRLDPDEYICSFKKG